jgi:hypothetical protein
VWVIRDRGGRSYASMYVRFCPKADKQRIVSVCPLGASSGRTLPLHRSEFVRGTPPDHHPVTVTFEFK